MSVSLFKRNALAAPFELAFDSQRELQLSNTSQGELMQIHYRDEEAIYVQASPDRVTVIFSTIFKEETDRIFGKVFLQVGYRIENCLESQFLHRNLWMLGNNPPFKTRHKCYIQIVNRL